MLNTYIYMDIPDDIVIEILSRLSAKSLLRLRWACKYWFDLITRDGAFIKKHYHHITINSNDGDDDRIINNTSFMLYDDTYLPVIYTMNLRDMINNHHDDVGTLVNMNGCNLDRFVCNKFGEYPYIGFGGSCNGLILLTFHRLMYRLMHPGRLIGNNNSNRHFLWNPCTREFKELPCEPANTCLVHDDNYTDNVGYIVLGFGYDQINDDYKVLRINISNSTTSQLQLNDNVSAIDNLNMEIGIYTLGSNSWSTKILAGPLVKAHWQKLAEPGLFHNGALHWIRRLQQETCLTSCTIVSFDITKEEFRDIEGPNFISRLSLALGVLNGCLCIFQWGQLVHAKDLVIWIMKDYGVKDSWSKLFSINIEKVLADIRSGPYYSLDPVNQYLKDGGILMLTNRKVIASFDSKKEDKAGFMYSIRDYERGFVVATYIESLVSLNSGKYLTLAGSKTTTVTKQDLLEYEVVDGCLVKISQEQN